MGQIKYDSSGYSNTNYSDVEGLVGTKKPKLEMNIFLIIKNPPPPLTLFINPSNLTLNFTNKINPQRVRSNPLTGGYSVQHAHSELDLMSVTGLTAMMYYPTLGLTSKYSRYTAGYDQWQKLLAIFRNNGVNFNSKQDHIIDTVGRVGIYYDSVNYFGCFDDFSWKHTEEQPYNFEFNWSFTISKTDDANFYRETF